MLYHGHPLGSAAIGDRAPQYANAKAYGGGFPIIPMSAMPMTAVTGKRCIYRSKQGKNHHH
jgi:hypothetical protein